MGSVHEERTPKGRAHEAMMDVLICEDDSLIAMQLWELIEQSGHRVGGVVDTYDDALIMAEKFKPALALIDTCLSDGRRGLDISEALAERGVLSIIITSQINDIDPDHRAVEILNKPVNETRLRALIEQVARGEVKLRPEPW